MKLNYYKKHNSFLDLVVKNNYDEIEINSKIKNIISNSIKEKKFNQKEINILENINNDLFKNENKTEYSFKLTSNVIDEILSLEEEQIAKYLIHRYRYEIYPRKRILHEYPPYLQIEPTSICNYRCVFCFMTDSTLTDRKNGHMGKMTYETFKRVVDAAKGNVEFISLASRGEPLACPDIEKMLYYTEGKFLNLKINTNASLINEKKAHAILSGGVKTLVVSADAADEETYKKLRVRGDLKKVLKNLELFNSIKEKSYKKSKIITRVSGVKVSDDQNFDKMKELWGGLVDQVAFVDYNPWENSYDKEANNIKESCSDLWRRMFVWWDGKVNPCDVDYKSNLYVGEFDNDLSKLWNSKKYNFLRTKHLEKKRCELNPCKSCTVI